MNESGLDKDDAQKKISTQPKTTDVLPLAKATLPTSAGGFSASASDSWISQLIRFGRGSEPTGAAEDKFLERMGGNFKIKKFPIELVSIDLNEILSHPDFRQYETLYPQSSQKLRNQWLNTDEQAKAFLNGTSDVSERFSVGTGSRSYNLDKESSPHLLRPEHIIRIPGANNQRATYYYVTRQLVWEGKKAASAEENIIYKGYPLQKDENGGWQLLTEIPRNIQIYRIHKSALAQQQQLKEWVEFLQAHHQAAIPFSLVEEGGYFGEYYIVLPFFSEKTLEDMSNNAILKVAAQVILDLAQQFQYWHVKGKIAAALESSDILIEFHPEKGWVPHMANYQRLIAIGSPEAIFLKKDKWMGAEFSKNLPELKENYVGKRSDVYWLGTCLEKIYENSFASWSLYKLHTEAETYMRRMYAHMVDRYEFRYDLQKIINFFNAFCGWLQAFSQKNAPEKKQQNIKLRLALYQPEALLLKYNQEAKPTVEGVRQAVQNAQNALNKKDTSSTLSALSIFFNHLTPCVYVRWKDKLYYVNSATDCLIKYSLTCEKLQEFDQNFPIPQETNWCQLTWSGLPKLMAFLSDRRVEMDTWGLMLADLKTPEERKTFAQTLGIWDEVEKMQIRKTKHNFHIFCNSDGDLQNSSQECVAKILCSAFLNAKSELIDEEVRNKIHQGKLGEAGKMLLNLLTWEQECYQNKVQSQNQDQIHSIMGKRNG